MKRLLTASLFLACFAFSIASPGPGPKAAVPVVPHSNSLGNAGAVRLRFENLIAGMEEKDSMLVIFDRYDHTAAGVVHRVCVAGNDQSITVDDIAAGKYYVIIQCVGLHRDHLEKMVTIRVRRSATVRIRLTPSEVFSKNNVVIPAFHPDLSDLSVVRRK